MAAVGETETACVAWGDTPYLRIGMGRVGRGRLKTAQRFFRP
ncbi:hypothetical protein HMPREF9123_1876 [Neisseria bacilliformis ATCC BAA-1200]|uniref:Uncharacterized protein n=1 Tax=Neisseria bacilliformis ATCC BAA-1200 TaxID=888742 RepID=F2BDS0_9NEIS|nr:hypothetical protein HMPREF9123_1876 [Neisseria bacilliformis ATCC BAA-1200]